MKMNNIKHVFFDLDHTLWDFGKNSDLTFTELFSKHKIEIDVNSFLEVYKPLNRVFWKLYREEKVTKAELRYQRLMKTFDTVNYSISDELIDILAIEYIDSLPSFNHLFEGTFEILEYLKDKYELHIITNGFEEIQTKKMESSNLLSYFNVIVTSESVGVKKPDPKVFNFAVDTANATIDNSIMIGDSIEADIEGALSVGMRAIHASFENESIDSSKFNSVTSLLELKQYL
jgi:putative hydrolase of the HAD superfamily